MFVVNEDLSIYATRGDIVFFNVSAKDGDYTYKFQPGDIVRMSVYGKKDAEEVLLQKDFPVSEVSESVFIYLEEADTKFGDIISKHKDYWYEVVLNPDTAPQTMIGYDEDGAKVFRLFPESDEIEDDYDPQPEDFPVVDEELDMTSPRPVANQAIARAVTTILDTCERTNEAVAKLHVTPEMFGAIGDGVADDTEAVQAALNNGGSTCVLINKYGITQELAIADGVSVRSEDGAEIIALAEMEKMLHLNRTEVSTPQTISVTLDGRGMAQTGLYVAYCANLFIQKVRTRDFASKHIHIADGYECFMSDIYCRNNLPYESGRVITGIVMDGTDSRVNDSVVVNCNVGFEFNESVHCTGIHPWNNDVDYIKDSVGVKCNAICFIDGSEIDTMGIGIQQINYFQSYVSNTRFMFTKEMSDFTPVYIENKTRQVYCSSCVFMNPRSVQYTLASNAAFLVVNQCTFSDSPATDSKWVNTAGMGAKYLQLVVSNDATGVVIPANGYSKFVFNVDGIMEFDALHYTVAYDEGGYTFYKVIPGSGKITVIVFNHHADDVTLRYSILNVMVLRNNGDTIFPWASYTRS